MMEDVQFVQASVDEPVRELSGDVSGAKGGRLLRLRDVWVQPAPWVHRSRQSTPASCVMPPPVTNSARLLPGQLFCALLGKPCFPANPAVLRPQRHLL